MRKLGWWYMMKVSDNRKEMFLYNVGMGTIYDLGSEAGCIGSNVLENINMLPGLEKAAEIHRDFILTAVPIEKKGYVRKCCEGKINRT